MAAYPIRKGWFGWGKAPAPVDVSPAPPPEPRRASKKTASK
jgi:hypothetical protein